MVTAEPITERVDNPPPPPETHPTVLPRPPQWQYRIKQAILPTYYCTTWPFRQACLMCFKRRGHLPITIVTFHRVADDASTPWTTPADVFRRKIDWLRQHGDLVSLEEAQRRIRCGSNRRPTVSITFDDGYFSNCHYALPLLLREKIPFTYFVTSDPVLRQGYFEHDRRVGQRLRANTVEQLQELVEAGVEIGAHTRTHPNLARVQDPLQLHDEVVGARDDLQTALGCRIRYFAFPFGGYQHLNRQVFRLAADAGFAAVLSSYGGYNFPGDDAFHLQRPSTDGNAIWLKNWVMFDPYKLCTIRRYEYR